MLFRSGNIDYEVTEEELKNAFNEFNPSDVKLLKTPIGYSRGFAFVDFEKKEDADKAVAAMSKKQIKKREIFVEVARPLGQKPRRMSPWKRHNNRPQQRKQVAKEISETNVFVKNLPFSTTDEEFMKLFEKYEPIEATIIKRQIKRANKEVSKGYGFVTLKSKEDQAKAIAEMNDTEIEGRKITVAAAFKKTEKEEEKKN